MAAGNGRKPAETPAEADTKRVVMKREDALVIPEGCDPKKVEEAAKILGHPRKTPKTVWWEVGEFEGGTKEKAIEAHAGKPGTADAKPGAYKAPTVRAWAGGLLYEKPPEPLVERKALA